MRAHEERPEKSGTRPHRGSVTARPPGPVARGPLPASVTALQSTAGNMAVQRAFAGELSGLSTDQVLARLKSRYPNERFLYRTVNDARRGAAVHDTLAGLAAALGVGAPQQQGEAATAPEASASAAAPAASESVTTTPAASESVTAAPATRIPVAPGPAVKSPPPPVPPRPVRPGTAVSVGAGERASSAPAPAPVQAPAGERAERDSLRTSEGDFKGNTEAARKGLDAELQTPGRYLRSRGSSRLTGDVFEKMAASMASAQNSDALLQKYLNQLYSCLEWTGRAPITVYTDEANGKGDLMLGVKTADALRENFPVSGENKNDISLMTHKGNRYLKKHPDFFEQFGHPYTVLGGMFPDAPALAPGAGPTDVVVAPQLGSTKPFQESVGKWGSEVSAMNEYARDEPLPAGAQGRSALHTTGLEEHEAGITFHAGLRAYKKEQDAKTDEREKRAARLDHLEALKSKELITALFPPEQERTARDFAASAGSRLYFAYSNKSAQRFALTVAEVEHGSSHDVHVVQSTPKAKPTVDASVAATLAGLGVSKVRLVEVDLQTSQVKSTDVATGGQGKTMHWITTSGVPHDDMITMIKASEPIMMTTGNQSTSEALSAGKTILYESIGQKQSRAFRDSLYKHAGIAPTDRTALAAVSRDHDREGAVPGQPEFKAAARVLKDTQANDRMGRLSDEAAATKNLDRWIGGGHLRGYLKKSALSDELNTAEAQLSSSRTDPAAYRRFVDHLRGLPESAE